MLTEVTLTMFVRGECSSINIDVRVYFDGRNSEAAVFEDSTKARRYHTLAYSRNNSTRY